MLLFCVDKNGDLVGLVGSDGQILYIGNLGGIIYYI
jgi:hypothetical protein